MKLYILIFCLLVSLNAFAEDEAPAPETYRDPFDSVIPDESSGVEASTPGQEETIEPPKVTIEGVAWGVDVPQAIIDGEVYKAGDMLKGVEAKVFKIEKNAVLLEYKGKIFETGIQKGTTEQKEAQ
ncbi:MAG: hypothetical protein PHV55_02985 [Candidatus Omnitrophica bacterium]|nr:hypothetical protein [Candidatus Omnitrophota bacterium]